MEEEYIRYEVEDIEQQSGKFKIEEYFRYFDLNGTTEGATLSDMLSSTVMVLAYKSLKKAIENDIFADDTEVVVYDISGIESTTLSAYIVANDIPESSILKNDVLILDLEQKSFIKDGLYVVKAKGGFALKHLTSDNGNDTVVARVCEIQRKL